MGRIRAGLLGVLVLAGVTVFVPAGAGVAAPAKAGGNDVASHWTKARMRDAVSRDLRVDARGLAFVEQDDGSLAPHGHATGQLFAAKKGSKPVPAKPPGSGDTAGPSVTNRNPASGVTIGASHTFAATVTDATGVRSVTFTIVSPGGTTQSFTPAANGSTYSATISGFTSGAWSWRVVAKDTVGTNGNTTTTTTTPFTVSTGGGGGSGDDVVNDPWTGGGTVQGAAGRIYFEMPTNRRLSRWTGYVCSGTVAEDATSGRSVIITAAHCVYDDVNKAFARNVLFIPNQDGTTGSSTDTNCSNDPMGCWTPSFGVVDRNWTTRTFPNNIPWDYAFYVVPDTGAHSGTPAPSNALDQAAGDLPVQTAAPTAGAVAHALGYSYSDDPNFMYCAEALGTEPDYNDWWLGQCELSGGSSGGPWLQPVSGGDGPIISVNSWGYTSQPGMAGPRLVGTSAGCVFGIAKSQSFAGVSNRGVAATC